MREFLKMTFATMTGYALIMMTMAIVMIIMVASIATLSTKSVVLVPKNSVLTLKLDQDIPDRGSKNPFSSFDFTSMSPVTTPGLNEILESITKAKTDDNIKGIYLELGTVPAGIATLEEIRNALIDFKKSGKFIISYGEEYTQKAYYIASVSDSIFLNPEGSLVFKGLNGEIMFFKGLFEKLDVDMQVIRHGKFKSAVEPFVLDKMSDANKEQTLKYLSTIWDHILDGIATSRNLTKDDLNMIADSMKIQKPEDAVAYKLVDQLMYKDELQAELRKKLGIGENDKISMISISKYVDVPDNSKKDKSRAKDKIAVIYALGQIQSGKGDDETIGSETISEAIRKARLDSTVKAVVLRVNSPGGSALASDVIWREVMLTKKVKPVVASMGDVAASGGYYISCAASKIIASPNTITGSIGVFGLIPNFQGFFNKQLGITFDNVKTNNYADFGTLYRSLTESEKNIYQTSIEDIYQTFITHVAEGRNMTVDQVDSIGQGRVWSGVDAKEIGLVDDFGGLNKSIEVAAQLAKLDNYRIVSYPVQKDPLTKIIEELSGSSDNSQLLKKEFGEVYEYYKFVKDVKKMQGVQARLPYLINIY